LKGQTVDTLSIEIGVVGTILCYTEVYHHYKAELKEEYFSDPFHRAVYRAIELCGSESLSPSAPNLMTVGGFSGDEMSRILGLASKAGALSELPFMVRKLAEEYTRRMIDAGIMSIKTKLAEGDVRECLDGLQSVVASCDRVFQSFSAPNLANDIDDFIEQLNHIASGEVQLVRTGYGLLDGLLDGGLGLGDLVIIGGTPGVGKTSFMLNLTLSMLKSGTPIAFIEGEMTKFQVLTRLNAIQAATDKNIVRNGKRFNEVSLPFLEWLHQKPLHLVECVERTPSELKRRIEYLASVKKCKVIFVDYLQVFRSRIRGASEYDEVSATAAQLRQLALKLKVCIVAASSLNRSHVSNNEKPGLHSFRGSGEIEHYMGTGMILTNEQDDSRELSTRRCTVELHVVKGREHARGVLNFDYDLATQSMTESGRDHFPAPFAISGSRDNSPVF
jgi:replicative DNA helicase